MPINILITSTAEIFAAALDASREMSVKILKLADLNMTPLAPGEDANARRHQIAKHAKKLAEAFLVLDDLVRAAQEQMVKSSDVTSGPVGVPPPDNKDAN